MIKDLTINASSRDAIGKGHARRLRAQGMIPASVYGGGQDALAVAVNAREIASILRSDTGRNTIFKLSVDDGAEPATVIIKDLQIDPVKGRLLHADLLRLEMNTATRVSVSVEIVGEPVGVKLEGGILETQIREVEIECLPGDIPDHLRVDVSHMHVGDHVTVADLIYDRDKVKLLMDEQQVIAGVLAPRLVEEAAPVMAEAEAEATGEPEVIK
ncbi:MAG TPA: 50S ribosomal protein L25, partial [Blastocatellia bacterium]|nr:50S ribosomal protein L25 [Blastocatellia bacterium]